MDYGEWLTDDLQQDILRVFPEVQYSRNLFPSSCPAKVVGKFFHSLPTSCKRWATKRSAFSASLEQVQGYHGDTFCIEHAKLDAAWHLYVVAAEGMLTLLAVTNSEVMQEEIEERLQNRDWVIQFGLEVEGFVKKPMGEFLALAYRYLEEDPFKISSKTFSMFFDMESDLVLDDDELEAVESWQQPELTHILLAGEHGAGKSTAGFLWLAQHSPLDGNRLYIAQSKKAEEEAKWLYRYENRKLLAMEKEQLPEIRYTNCFRFFLQAAAPCLEDGVKIWKAEESYQAFYELSGYLPSIFWKNIPGDTLQERVYSVWNEIHGVIKGAVFNRKTGQLNEPLSRAQYQNMKSFRKDASEASAFFMTATGAGDLYKIYERYENYRISHHALDENDLARVILEHAEDVEASDIPTETGIAFVDDIQWLTEVQLQTLLYLLRGTKQRMLAANTREHPSFFQIGLAQQLMESNSNGTDCTERITLRRNYKEKQKPNDGVLWLNQWDESRGENMAFDEAWFHFFLEEYGAALDIYRSRNKEDEHMIAMLCEGRFLEAERRDAEALKKYMDLTESFPQGRHELLRMLERDDLSAKVRIPLQLYFLGDKKLNRYCKVDSLQEIFTECHTEENDIPMDEALTEICSQYPVLRERLKAWETKALKMITRKISALDAALKKHSAWRTIRQGENR